MRVYYFNPEEDIESKLLIMASKSNSIASRFMLTPFKDKLSKAKQKIGRAIKGIKMKRLKNLKRTKNKKATS